MTEEERIFAGILFNPGDEALRAIKLRTHNLCTRYNQTLEDEGELRSRLLSEMLGGLGEGGFIQGPLFLHYGTHTMIGKRFFGNFNLTIQDDARVVIGDDVNFGPNVTIVTPVHPLLAAERRQMRGPDGRPAHLCYAKPVTIGSNVWVCANAVICGGVTIGDSCVIGAGSVVTRDIPPNTLAAGVPCRVIREITEADTMANLPEIMADCRPL